jgi:hypothetical protein
MDELNDLHPRAFRKAGPTMEYLPTWSIDIFYKLKIFFSRSFAAVAPWRGGRGIIGQEDGVASLAKIIGKDRNA